MKPAGPDILITAATPIVWGTTYIVATQYLPEFSPIWVALLRALPAGIILMLMMRQLPKGEWWWRAAVLGTLNIGIFLTLLFIATYRLPGGVAATVISLQPLIVVILTLFLLPGTTKLVSIIAAITGLVGVALLVLTSEARLDTVGVIAGLGAAACMATGTILTRKWLSPFSMLAMTGWQLTAGGLVILPFALLFAPLPTSVSTTNILALLWLGIIGGALAYVFWFRGVKILSPAAVSSLLFLSPLTAVILGWMLLEESLTIYQVSGLAIVLASIYLSQRAERS